MTHYGYFTQDKFMIKIKVNDDETFWGENPAYALYQVRSYTVVSITNISDNTTKTGINKYKVGNSYNERPKKSYYKSEEAAFSDFVSIHYDNIKYYFPNGISGFLTTYHPNGQVYQKYFHNDLIKDGDYLEFHDNGQISTTSTYINGIKHGDYKSYYLVGSIHIDTTYKNGKIDGQYKKYLPNGNIIEESIYIDGVKQ